jgi:hypothetical protein
MQIEIQEMFLDFMNKIQFILPNKSQYKNACFAHLHKAQNSAMKALDENNLAEKQAEEMK